MGILGLSSLIKENPGFLKPYKLHNSYVVIDGDNLLYPLYFHDRINVTCGGDYDKYTTSIREYFAVFLECKIKPIVVFDGGIDKSGRKLKTILKNVKARLSLVKKIAQNNSYYERVLPILARNACFYILNELNIPFVICDYEADDQIASLANYYNCPVISADSDFFVFNMQNGFILLYSIDTTVILDIDSDGKEYKYLNCYIYYIDEFLACFHGIEKTVLPLLGTLLGNDYVEFDVDEFDNFFTNIQLPKYEETYCNVYTLKHKRIIDILYWLKNKGLNDAINQILPYLKSERREYIKTILENSVADYEIYDYNLLHIIIDQKLYGSDSEFSFDSRLTTPCGNSIPPDFIFKYHSAHDSSFFINVIVLHKLILNPQIDELSSSSSYVSSRYIRKIIYGILIHHDVDGNPCQNEKCLASIEEYDRHGIVLDKELVEPIFTLEGIGMLPKINELSSLRKEKARLILMKVLGINEHFVTDLPSKWELFIGSIKYWLCNSFPYSTEAFLYALIVSLIYYDLIEHDPYEFIAENHSKSTKANNGSSSIKRVLSKVSQSERYHAARSLKKYFWNPYINRDNPLLLNIVHSYSQLQSCIMSTMYLNNLLGTCMKNPDIHKCLNGVLLYNLTKDISTWQNPTAFVAQILGTKSALFSLFILLDLKICHGIPRHCIVKNYQNFEKSRKDFNNAKRN